MNKILKRILANPITVPVLVVTFFTFFSRFLGFVRQYLLLRNLSEIESDLLLAANKIPELIAVTLLMGTIYSSVLPIASRLETNDPENKKISRYLNLINITLIIVIGLLSILGIIFAPWLLESRWFTSQETWKLVQENNLFNDYILATRILFLAPIAFALQAVWGVFLTLKKRFLVYSLAGVIANLGSIIALVFSQGDFVKVAFGMVWGAVLATFLYLIYCVLDGLTIPSLQPSKLKKDFQNLKAEFIQTWTLFAPRILVIDGYYAASIMINPLVVSEGQITSFDIGNSIQSAFFIIITSLSTVLFPDLSKLFQNSKGHKEEFWNKMIKYLWLSTGIGVVVMGITIIGTPLVILLFNKLGQQQETGDMIILVSQITSVSLVFRSIREILLRYVYIRERHWQPLILSTLGLFSTIVSTLVVYFLKFDVLIAGSIGYIFYNLVWVIWGLAIFINDYQNRHEGTLTVIEN